MFRGADAYFLRQRDDQQELRLRENECEDLPDSQLMDETMYTLEEVRHISTKFYFRRLEKIKYNENKALRLPVGNQMQKQALMVEDKTGVVNEPASVVEEKASVVDTKASVVDAKAGVDENASVVDANIEAQIDDDDAGTTDIDEGDSTDECTDYIDTPPMNKSRYNPASTPFKHLNLGQPGTDDNAFSSCSTMCIDLVDESD